MLLINSLELQINRKYSSRQSSSGLKKLSGYLNKTKINVNQRKFGSTWKTGLALELHFSKETKNGLQKNLDL